MMSPDAVPERPEDLEEYIRRMEDRIPDLYPQARAQVVWSGPEAVKTPLSLVYLHGFRATHQEGDPVHYRVARHGGYNLYLSRHRGHGRNCDLPLQHLQAKDLLESARKAMEIGLRIGEKVILMGTSTGGSMALWLAGLPEFRDRISALVLYAPLIDFRGWSALLRHPLPRFVLQHFPGPLHPVTADAGSRKESRIWYSRYALQGALALGAFVQEQMTPRRFQRVSQPVFTGYSEDDRIVSIAAIHRMVGHLGTDRKARITRHFPDAGTHVICSGILSKAVDQVVESTEQFLKIHAG